MTVEQAKTAAKALVAEIAQGHDPQVARQAARHEQTIGGLWQYWIDGHAKLHKREASRKEDERMYRLYLAQWATRRLSAISKSDIQTLLHRIAEGTVATRQERQGQQKTRREYRANRVHELIRAMYNKAPDIGYRGENPALGIQRFPEERRDRFLQGDELPRFFRALFDEPDATFRDFFLLALLCGRAATTSRAWRGRT